MEIEFAQYLLHEGILDYFEIVSHKASENEIHFYFEEKNLLSKEYNLEIAQSKDLLPEITVEDFPLPGKSVLLYIKRRCLEWLETSSFSLID